MKFNEAVKKVLDQINKVEKTREVALAITNIEQAALWHGADLQKKKDQSYDCDFELKEDDIAVNLKKLILIVNSFERSRENSLVATNLEQGLLWYEKK